MDAAWMPVLFAAVIVIGCVGGQLMHTVLKELLPLIRNLAEQRTLAPPAEVGQLQKRVADLERSLARIESGQTALREETQFIQKLLEEPAGARAVPSTRDRV